MGVCGRIGRALGTGLHGVVTVARDAAFLRPPKASPALLTRGDRAREQEQGVTAPTRGLWARLFLGAPKSHTNF